MKPAPVVAHPARVTSVDPLEIRPRGSSQGVPASNVLGYTPTLDDEVAYVTFDKSLLLVLGGFTEGGGPAVSNVLTGDSSGTDSTSITSTTTGAGSSVANQANDIAIGNGASTNGGVGGNVVIGNGAITPLFTNPPENSVAIGTAAECDDVDAVAVGHGSDAANVGAVAAGAGAYAGGAGSVAVGRSTQATTDKAIAVGDAASATGAGAIAIGNVTAVGDGDVLIGLDAAAYASDPSRVGVGNSVIVGGDSSVAIGAGAIAHVVSGSAENALIAIGATSQARKFGAVAVGNTAEATETNSSAFGHLAAANDEAALALGYAAQALHAGGVAIGHDDSTNAATTTAANDFALGVDAHNYLMPGTVLGLRKAIVAKSANYTLTNTDSTVVCTGTNTQTLPSAAGRTGRIFTVKNVGVGVITVGTTSSQNIDSATTKTLAALAFATVQSDGTQWWIIG